jgi:hypothetical protein
MVNNVIEMLNYVIAARPSLLNFMIADTEYPDRALDMQCAKAQQCLTD